MDGRIGRRRPPPPPLCFLFFLWFCNKKTQKTPSPSIRRLCGDTEKWCLDDPATASAAAAAAARIKSWTKEYEAVEAEVEKLCAERATYVSAVFGSLSAREKREYNAAHAASMKPLRERRGRLHRLIKSGGFVNEADVEREDIETDEPHDDDGSGRFIRG